MHSFHRTLTVLATLLAGSVLSAPAAPAAPKRSKLPNIIWIMADDLGYGDVGCYGQKAIRTPNIDLLAWEGMRFTQFYAGATVCAPSRCTLMTGKHNGHAYIRGNAKTNLRPEDVTVAEVLKTAGYRTALVGKWGLGHEGSSGVPTRQGFDYFFGYLDQTHAHNSYPTFLLRNEERVPLRNVVPNEGPVGQGIASVRLDFAPDLMAEEALGFIDRSKDAPFFLYYSPTLPHANNEAGRNGMEVPDVGEYASRDWPERQKQHAAMITRLDSSVGRIMERLKQHGIDRNTLVIFTSDNGPHREGGNDPDYHDSNGPLRGTKRDMYDGGIRVPFVTRWPARIPAHSASTHVGYFGDFMSTAAEIARVPAPPSDGISFLPALRGRREDQPKHRYLYWEFYEQGGKQGVRMGDWKGVCRPFFGPVELYNIREDIGEERNVAAEHPKIVAKIQQIMKEAHVPSPLWTVRAAPAAPDRLP
jgi:arylsulfatase A-like enzyme